MERLSILELEQRFNLSHEANKLEYDFLQRRNFNQHLNFIELINQHILSLPFNKTSRNLNEYLEERNIFNNKDNFIDNYLYRLSFYCNFISWSLSNSKSIFDSFYEESNRSELEFILEIISYNLENLNYCMHEMEYDNKNRFTPIIFTKRNVDVDSILPLINFDLRIDLLTYLDFRIEDNLKEKEAIIGRIYKYLEEIKHTLNIEPYKSLFTSTKRALNYARHIQKDLSIEDKIIICDESFYMFIHLIRWPEIRKYQDNLKNLPL